MKNKNRLFVLLAAVLIGAVAYLNPASPLATAVPIPEQINVFVAGLILISVTAGFTWLFNFVGLDLRDYASPIAGVLSTFVLGTLQGWVDLIPGAYDTYVTIAFNIIVVILSGVGAVYLLARHFNGKPQNLIAG